MDAPLVITIIARDRPGLVETLAITIAQHGGNWLESRMSRLGGQFAGILRLSVECSEKEKLLTSFGSLQNSGIKISVQPDEPPPGMDLGRTANLTLVGQDRTGIIRQISQAFARGGVNVEELETEVTSAPMSGEMLFHARVEVHIPPTCDLPTLRAELEKIATDLMVDVKLTEVPIPK